jgi:large subunit ribosomal protein L2
MGKRIITQARGKGGPRYRAPSFRYAGKAAHVNPNKEKVSGEIVGLLSSQGHSAPLAEVVYADGVKQLMIAPEGIKVGMTVDTGEKVKVQVGNTLPLDVLPEGTLIYNIEGTPGDGGQFCRASGGSARVIAHSGEKVIIELPSKRQKTLHSQCRATVGVVAGGGRPDKPILKAGTRHYMMKAKNKLYPIVSGSAMNAVDHPFGNKRTSRKSKARPIPRNAPPGRKVGMVAARQTGRKVHRKRREQ